MFDIADKLFPNILTLLAQLAATGVIYMLYRKYLHEPVMSYLDKQAEELNEAQGFAKTVEQDALAKEKQLEAEHQEKLEALRRSQQAMKREAELEREKVLKQAQEQRRQIMEQTELEIEKKKIALLKEVEDYVLELAVDVSTRTLENYSYDEDELYHSLEVELEQMNNETH